MKSKEATYYLNSFANKTFLQNAEKLFKKRIELHIIQMDPDYAGESVYSMLDGFRFIVDDTSLYTTRIMLMGWFMDGAINKAYVDFSFYLSDLYENFDEKMENLEIELADTQAEIAEQQKKYAEMIEQDERKELERLKKKYDII